MFSQRKKIKKSDLPPCPYPDLDCEYSMAGLCCVECEKMVGCENVCQNNTADEPDGCGRFMKGKKRNVE